MVQKTGAWLTGLVLVLLLLLGAGWLVWKGALLVSPDAARIWALLMTGLLPIVAWASWYFGHTEARGVLSGIDKAADKMFGLMTKTLSARVGTAKALQRTAPPSIVIEAPKAELPPVYFPELPGQVIDL